MDVTPSCLVVDALRSEATPILGIMARRSLGSWLSGPGSNESGPDDAVSAAQGLNDYPGQRLGLRKSGSGSIAPFGRRVGALILDWLIAVGLTALTVPLGLLTQEQFAGSLDARLTTMVIWWIVGAVSVRLFTFTPGQYVLGLTVISVDDRAGVGIVRALVRGLLIMLVLPALFTDADLRGLHDLATKTAVVRR